MAIDRTNKNIAKAVIEGLLPDAAIRQSCLKFLSDSILAAHSLGPDRWGITLYRNYLLMNCGSIEVLQIFPEWMHLIVDGKELLHVKGAKLDRRDGSGFYATVAGSMACDFDPKLGRTIFPQAQKAHLAIITKALRSKLVLGRKKAHSSGVIKYLEESLHLELPQPAYYQQEWEVLYSNYLERWEDPIEFGDELDENAHDFFQRWRREHWDNGFFINCKSGNNFVLHRCNCTHPGDGEWVTQDFSHSLTKHLKICSSDLNALVEWSVQHHQAILTACKDCKPDLPEVKYELPKEDLDYSACEGDKQFVTHLRRERDAKIVKRKKRQVLHSTGKLVCEVCGFDFFQFYGERGEGYCEAHHKKPLSQVEEKVQTKLEDLAILCSNCHRIIHRPPMLSLDELKSLLKRHESKLNQQ